MNFKKAIIDISSEKAKIVEEMILSICNLQFIMEKDISPGDFHCYGTSIDNTRLIFIRDIHSWTNAKNEGIYSS